MIDAQGYRANVGIVLADAGGRVLLAQRIADGGWQFPQGGIDADETPEQALFRELREEVGLVAQDVELVGGTAGWLRYRLPRRHQRSRGGRRCIGQKQRWFLLRFLGGDAQLRVDGGREPEFAAWRWVDYWQPLDEVIAFKRAVYESALTELAPLLFPAGVPPRAARAGG